MKTLIKKRSKAGLIMLALALSTVAVQKVSAQQRPAASPASKDSILLNGKIVSVKYAAPSVKGRDIFGKEGLLSKEKNFPIWRAGANSATTLTTDADLVINGLTVPKGSYTLFVSRADAENWELILNKQNGQWGLTYDKAQDFGKVKMTMGKTSAPVEMLNYKFTPDGPGKAKLTLSWENYSASVPVAVK